MVGRRWMRGTRQLVMRQTSVATTVSGDSAYVNGGSRKQGWICAPVVDEIRLWCFEQGLEAYKTADLPNSGRFVNDKVNNTIDEADYYIVVLTADEELTTGELRPRPNAMIEMGRLLDRNPAMVCVLKEDKVEMPSDYSSLVTEPLDNWRSVLQRELREAALL